MKFIYIKIVYESGFFLKINSRISHKQELTDVLIFCVYTYRRENTENNKCMDLKKKLLSFLASDFIFSKY